MAIKEHDFIELDYTGILDDGTIFDTTSEDIAKKHDINNPKAAYKPIIICVGEQQVVPGLDQALIGKEIGNAYMIKVPTEQAFGKKDAKMIRLVPLRVFEKQNIMPQPGLQVDMDDTIATVLRVGGGRVLVDFNHPLAGKQITYEITPKRQVTDPKEQIKSYLEMVFPVKTEVDIVDDKATITLAQDLPKEIAQELSKKLSELTRIKTIEFKKEEKKKEAQEKKEEQKTEKTRSPRKQKEEYTTRE